MTSKLSRRKLADYCALKLTSGSSRHDVMRELAGYLVESRREKEAELITRDIETALLSRGTAVATVISARQLSAEAKAATSEFIQGKYKAVDNVILREELDESLIGGVKLELPDKQLDASVKNKLEKLKV